MSWLGQPIPLSENAYRAVAEARSEAEKAAEALAAAEEKMFEAKRRLSGAEAALDAEVEAKVKEHRRDAVA